MESQELDLETPQVHKPPIEACEPESGHIDAAEEQERRELREQEAQVHETEAHETELKAAEAPAAETAELEAREASARQADARQEETADADVRGVEGPAIEAQASESPGEEDETQLAAIRELMQRAFARGAWLTLGEIAEATEFAEASISAQLRHLRKPHHGRHRVEKRRRRPAREIRDGWREPVIWEYRVLPKRARGTIRSASAEIAPR
jgi:hypothetical protein